MGDEVRPNTAAITAGDPAVRVQMVSADGASLGLVTIASLAEGGVTGAATPARAILLGGSDGTNLRGLKTQTDGTVLVAPALPTSGGYTISRTLSANNTTGIVVKGSIGQVFGWYLSNTNAAARFVKLYNKATAPTVGTDTPVLTIPVPGSSAVSVEFSGGIAFATGIGLGITTVVTDADTTAPAANEVVANVFYK